jgi:hypothetical protein
VLAGYAIDIGGSLLVSFIVSAVYVASLANEGMSEDAMAAALANVPTDSAVFVIGTLAGGAACDTAGSRRNESR